MRVLQLPRTTQLPRDLFVVDVSLLFGRKHAFQVDLNFGEVLHSRQGHGQHEVEIPVPVRGDIAESLNNMRTSEASVPHRSGVAKFVLENFDVDVLQPLQCLEPL